MLPEFVRGRATWLAYALLAYYGFLLNVLGPVMPSLRAERGLSYTVTSLHFSAFAAGMLLAGLAGERIIRRLGRATAARLAVLGMALGVFLLAFGQQPALTLLGVLTMGTLGSVLLAIVPASLSDLHGPLRGVALTEANTASTLVAVLAPLLVGAAVGLNLGWRAALAPAFLALVPLLYATRSAAVRSAAVRSASVRSATIRSALVQGVPVQGASAQPVSRLSPARSGTSAAAAPRASRHRPGLDPIEAAYWVRWLAIVLVVSVEFCFIYWTADFLSADGGLSAPDAAGSVSIFLLAMLVGRLMGSRLATHAASRRILVGSIGVVGLSFIAFWLPLPIPARLAGLFVAGLGVANLYPMALSLAIGVLPERADLAASRGVLASGTAILAAPLILGTLADHVGLRTAYLIEPALLAAALLVVLSARPLTTAQRASAGAMRAAPPASPVPHAVRHAHRVAGEG